MTSFTDTSFDRHDLEGGDDQSDTPEGNYNPGRRKAMRSSMTWTSSIGEPHPPDQDGLEDRSSYAVKYNLLAKKHGVRELLPENYGPPNTDPTNASDKPGSWFSRKILRKTSSTQSIKPDKQLKHKRSFSDLSLRLKLKKNGLQDKDLQELVRICGCSLLYLPTEYAKGSLIVPTCFRATAQYLVQHAPSTRGVFRVPGSHSVVAALYNHYCDMDRDGHLVAGTVRCPTLPEHIKCDVHDVASAFKRFLSGLPGGILGSLTLFDSLVSIQSQLQGTPELTRTKQSRIRARLIALSVSSLRSHYRRDLICAVFGLLCMIGRAAEIARREDDKGRPLPTSDLMGYGPLGIVFGPLLVGNILDNYTMHLANPREGVVILPVSSPKSRKEKHKGKSKKGKSIAIDEGAIFNAQVDKIRVANGIAEMLITHWRDVVRHLKSLSALNVAEGHTPVGIASATVPYLRPSASESFALRMPPDWGDGTVQTRHMDRSPTPNRQIMGLKGSYSQYFVPTNATLKVKKQRGSHRLSSSKVLAAAALKTALSPTLEERGLEQSPETKAVGKSSTVTAETPLRSSGTALAVSTAPTVFSSSEEEQRLAKPSREDSVGKSKTSPLQASGGPQTLALAAFKTVIRPAKEELAAIPKGLSLAAAKATISPSMEDKSLAQVRTQEDQTSLLHDCSFSWTKDVLQQMDLNSKRLTQNDVKNPEESYDLKASGANADAKYYTGEPGRDSAENITEKESRARPSKESEDLGIATNLMRDLQQLSSQPPRASTPKIAARLAFLPVAGVRNQGTVRRTPASEPGFRQPKPFTSNRTAKSELGHVWHRQALASSAQFGTRLDPLTKISEREDRASLATLTQAMQLMQADEVETEPESIANDNRDNERCITTASDNVVDPRIHDNFQSEFSAVSILGPVPGDTVHRKAPLDTETTRDSRKKRISTRTHNSTPGGSQVDVGSTPKTSQHFSMASVIQGSGRIVGNVRALAAKFDSALPISPAGPPQPKLPTISNRSPSGQDQVKHRRESILAPYTTNPSSPARSQKYGRTEKTPVKVNLSAAAADLTPQRALGTFLADSPSIRTFRKSSDHTMTPLGYLQPDSPVIADHKPLRVPGAWLAAAVTPLDYAAKSTRSTDTSAVSRKAFVHKEDTFLSSKSVPKRSENSEAARNFSRSRKQDSDATLLPLDVLYQTSNESDGGLSTRRSLPSGNTSLLYGQIRQLQRQVRGLEDENLLLKHQLETRDNHDIQKLKEKLKDVTSSLRLWKARAEGAEKELEIITKLASRSTSLQAIRNPLAVKNRDSSLSHMTQSYDGAPLDDELSTSSYHGLDGAGSHRRSSGSNDTVIRDLRDAVAGLDHSIWLDRTVFCADSSVPNRLRF